MPTNEEIVRENIRGESVRDGDAYREWEAFSRRQDRAEADFRRSRNKTRHALIRAITIIYGGALIHSLVYAVLYGLILWRGAEASQVLIGQDKAILGIEFVRTPLVVFIVGSFTVIVACIIALGSVGRAQWGAPSKDSPYRTIVNPISGSLGNGES